MKHTAFVLLGLLFVALTACQTAKPVCQDGKSCAKPLHAQCGKCVEHSACKSN